MAELDLSPITNYLASYDKEVAEAEKHLADVKARREKAKSDLAKYLDKSGLLGQLAITKSSTTKPGAKLKTDGSERKTRTSRDDAKAEVERNKATYKPAHYEHFKGINPTTGKPIFYQGLSLKNTEIRKQMDKDEQDYRDANSGHDVEAPDSEAGKSESTAATAPKPASHKKKAPVAA